MNRSPIIPKQRCLAGKLGVTTLQALFLGCLLACGSQPGPMTGNWAMTFISSGSLNQVVAAVSLNQSGDTVSGTLTSGLCREKTSVSGNLQGMSLALQFGNDAATGSLTGTVNDNFTLATGTYVISGNWCAQAAGTGSWSAAFMSS